MKFLKRFFQKIVPKSIVLALMVLLLITQLPADYIINPFTGLQDYYEPASGTFDVDVTFNEDVFMTWADAADHMAITQTSLTGIENQALISINDDRTGATANENVEATLYIDSDASYALYVVGGVFQVADWIKYDETDYNVVYGYQAGNALTATEAKNNVLFGYQAGVVVTTGDENVLIGFSAGHSITTSSYNIAIGEYALSELTTDSVGENVAIGRYAGEDCTDSSNVYVGASAGAENTAGYANVCIGDEAGEGYDGVSNYDYNVLIGASTGYSLETGDENTLIGNYAGSDLTSGARNVYIGNEVGSDETTGSDKLFIDNTDTATPLIWGDFVADNITINGDFNVTMDAALDQIVIVQSSITSTGSQPLILINDDRVSSGALEATIYMDTEGTYALYILDGYLGLADSVYFIGTTFNVGGGGINIINDTELFFGTQLDVEFGWVSNSTEDDLFSWKIKKVTSDDSSAIFMSRDISLAGTADHNDYLSPTFIMTNDEGADTDDYAGVVIGERTQADVKVAHYFDFYAMTGAVDGSADPANAELAAIFRFGASGSDVPDNATTPGDVLIEGNLEVNGMIYSDGGTSVIKTIILKVVAFDTAIPAAGNGKAYVTIPAELNGFDLVTVGAHVYTASDTGAVSVQIHNLTQTDDMLSTNITIDQDELDSKDAGTPPVVDGTKDDVATGDALRVDIDGAGANGTGLEIRMGFRLPL